MSYIGNPPVVQSNRLITEELVSVQGKTAFYPAGGYTPGQVDVEINGSTLGSADFTATDGSVITLANGCGVGDFVRIVAYGTATLANAVPANGSVTPAKMSTGAPSWDAAGNLLLGTTLTSGQGVIKTDKPGGGNFFSAGSNTTNAYTVYNSSNVGVYLVNGQTSWTANSDERIKDIIEPITGAAQKVSSLRAVIGKYKADEEGVRRAFLIAQDVQAVLPEAVNMQDDEMGTLGVQYTDMIPLLVAAITEQQSVIAAMSARIAALEA